MVASDVLDKYTSYHKRPLLKIYFTTFRVWVQISKFGIT